MNIWIYYLNCLISANKIQKETTKDLKNNKIGTEIVYQQMIQTY